MAEKKTYWLTDGYGAKAFVTGAEERDRWVPRGWSETVEPAADDMVWMHHPETDGRSQFAAGVVDTWKALGWEPAAPPEPVDVLHDAQLVDVRETSAPEAQGTTATSSANGGSKAAK